MIRSRCLRPAVHVCLLLLVVIVSPTRSRAQSVHPAGATISGHVSFADSDRPARFATVYLKAVAPPDPSQDFFSVLMGSAIDNMQSKQLNGAPASAEDQHDLSSARAAATGFLNSVSDAMLSATAGADGEYSFHGVPPGSYYLHARAAGYVDPYLQFTPEDLSSSDPATRKKVDAALYVVTVTGVEQVRENLRLERGGVIAGRVLYDDGSPAAGWTVRALPRRTASQTPSTSVLGIDLAQLPVGQPPYTAVADDTGRFRVAGLPTGEFILEAKLTTAALDREPFAPVASSAGSFLSILGGLAGMSGLRLVVYSGNATRLHDAVPVNVHAGEEQTGVDLVASVGSSRSVGGFVVSSEDGHPLNDGQVVLIAQGKDGQEDPSLRFSAAVHADGTFRFDYVPAPGVYVLRTLHVSDSSASAGMKLLGSMISEHKTLRSYARASTTITLKDEDLNGVKLAVEALGPAAGSAKSAGR